ncbi:ABC transporter ATP-binding protein [Niabella drilacis]|uniref:ABC-2 type transport system ATP-binding protein n=1 Tax=Niabella drilacis (strain DSM 25811 / CCM 8410 / CCUG 62505 / LMG 26954 / E90) TaxID=1285928 RepID=A0A1G6KRV9_NIADE|nr:ATP-binding cassette domain-containing protein [Niabella drilacis]SDC33076.1 ABC-2 type transport system ATP-binding protein [Niabella drilacis]
MISIDSLSKSFGSHQVLNNISICFQKGRVYGIVGENGAGKTTLFNCIAGIEDHQGRITADRAPLKNHLGFLQTEPYFFSKITGEEYLRLLCHARHKPAERAAQKNIFELPLKQYAATYSTGMKKKLALMAILMQENDYFILDEPFNGVDIQSNLLITAIIHKLRELGKTILISSHIFSTLHETCDEIHLLQNGVFSKAVARADFDLLEREMKQVSIGNKIEQMELK